MIARFEMAWPLLPFTDWLTVVVETVTIFPTGAFLMPLLIKSSAPDGGDGMVKLVAKPLLVMSEESHFGGVEVVF